MELSGDVEEVEEETLLPRVLVEGEGGEEVLLGEDHLFEGGEEGGGVMSEGETGGGEQGGEEIVVGGL